VLAVGRRLRSVSSWLYRWQRRRLGGLCLMVQLGPADLRSSKCWCWLWGRSCLGELHLLVQGYSGELRGHQARRLETDLRSFDRNEWRRVGPCLPAPVTVMGTELIPRVGTTIVCNPSFFIARLRISCVDAAELISNNSECRVAISRGARHGARPTEKENLELQNGCRRRAELT